MIEFDLHTHTLFSQCGIHTAIELLERARTLGMKGIAITDHGLTLGGRLSSVFFERFESPFPEVKLLKGVECNVLDEHGAIDLPVQFLQWIDVVLLGVHPNTPKGLRREAYTAMVINALEKNPVDIVTHPNEPLYPLDYRSLAPAARDRGAALELNNSKILYSRASPEDTIAMLDACKEWGCPIAVCSDTHAILELGRDDSVRPLLEKTRFPEELVVSRDEKSVVAFVNSRKEKRRSAAGRQCR